MWKFLFEIQNKIMLQELLIKNYSWLTVSHCFVVKFNKTGSSFYNIYTEFQILSDST